MTDGDKARKQLRSVVNLKVLLFSKCQRAAVACDEKKEFSFVCWAKHWRLWRTKKLECFVTIVQGKTVAELTWKGNKCIKRLRGADLMIIYDDHGSGGWGREVSVSWQGIDLALSGDLVMMGKSQAFSEFSEWCWDTAGQVEGALRPRVKNPHYQEVQATESCENVQL